MAERPLHAALALFALLLPLSIAGANMAWGLVVLALLARARQDGGLPWRAALGPLFWPLAAYCAAALLAGLLGEAPAHSLRQLNKDLHKLWLYALFSVAWAASRGPAPAAALGVGAAGAALVGIAQALPDFLSGAPAWNKARAHAFVHPVTFGQLMAFALLGALAALAAGARGRARAAAGALAALTAAALLLSNTRGAVAAAAAGAAAAMTLLPALRRWTLAALAAGALLVAAADLSNSGRSLLRQLADPAAPRSAGEGQTFRLTLWKAAVAIGRENPATGVGPGNYRAALGRRTEVAFEDGRHDWGTAHNLYLHHFAERGLAGLAALAWLLWAFWKRALDRARARADGANLWAFACATAFLVMNLTEVALQVELVWMAALFSWCAAESAPRAEDAGA